VRVRVEVGSDQLEQELQNAAQELGKDFKVSGFRQGKVPPQVVLQRVGREAVLDQAVRNGLPGWYEEALKDAGVAAVGDPDVNLESVPDQGDPLAFTIEVGVRPKAKLGDYKGVEVGRREPEISNDEVDSELERMREAGASLETVEREAGQGDFVVVDFTGYVDGEAFEGGEARGYLLELGSGRLIEGFEEQLTGASGGDERTVTVTFPDDYGNEELAGKEARFEVSVKEVKEKRLPELDDDFAIEAGGYDSIDELREEIQGRLRERDEAAIEREFREAAVDAVAAEADIDVPHDLVHSKAHEMWHQTAHRLQHQGIDPQQYLQITGKEEEELVTESEPEAERALRREAVLAAVIEAEAIEVSEDELIDALRAAATEPGKAEPSEKSLRRSLKKAKQRGQDEALREDIAMRKAVDLLVESATPISVEQAEAKGKLWTPGKEEQPAGELWTPGS
jgi:trigger factor